ncbi:ParA family protein [Bordetella sp. FB-8]|uniref:ParA family protein n=1 Tax=Bordetella sp. FB-8 TaxID=1159870 RepID=UPI0003AA7286|nr:ParA family protein [Bordetella sp. FB-8]
MEQRMKILVVAQGKGGNGKTATSAHSAWFAAEQRVRTLAIDFDTGNLSLSLSSHATGMKASALFGMGEGDPAVDRLAAKQASDDGNDLDLIAADKQLQALLPFAPQEQVIAKLKDSMETLSPHYDFCVIDTPPNLSVAVGAALSIADAVIAPVEMETYSIEGIVDMMTIVFNARKVNPKLQFLGIIPSRVDLRNPRHVAHLAQVQAGYSQFLTPFTIGQRTSIADALAAGEPVWKSRKTAARVAGTEMRAMGQYVLEKLHLNKTTDEKSEIAK